MAEQRDLALATIFTARIENFRSGIRTIQRELRTLNTEMARGAERAARPMNDLAKAQALYQKRVQEMSGVNKSYKKALDQVIGSTDGTARSVNNAIKYMDRMQATVQKQARTIDPLGKSMGDLGKRVDYVNLVNKDADGLLKRTANGFKVLDESAKRAAKSQSWIGKQIAQVEGAMSRLSAAMKVTAAYGAAATGLYAVVDALRAGVAEIIEYDQALKNLKAITGATDAEITAMGDTIKQVARTTKFSMTETADAMVLLGQAGFDAGESMDAIQAAANLATGTLSTMQTVTDLLSTAIRAFNLESFQAGQVSDIMANAINKSKLTVDKLRIAFNYVGPAAYAVGAELEEVAAAMMTLANSGLRASTIGTGLRQVFSRLVAPTAKLRESFEEHGIELDDLNVRVHGFVGVMHNLSEVFLDAESGAIDAQKAFELFGLRGANSILALMRGINSGEFQEALEHVYEVGTAANMAGIQIEGLSLQIKNLQDRFKSLMVELGERGFTDVFSGFITLLRELTKWLTEGVEDGVGGVIAEFTTWITSTLAVTAALAGLWKILKWVAAGIWTLSKAMLSSPIGWMIVGVGSLIALYKKYRRELRENLEIFQKEEISYRSRAEVLESYRKRLEKAYEAAKKDATQKAKYTALIERLTTEFEDLGDQIKAVGDNFESINFILRKETLTAYLNQLWNSLQALSEQEKIIDSTERVSGAMKMAGDKADEYKGKINELRKSFVEWLKEQARKVPIEAPEEYERGRTALEKFGEEARKVGKTTKQTMAEQAAAGEMIKNVIRVLIALYKAELISLEELRNYAKQYSEEAGVSAENFKKILEALNAQIDEIEARKEIEAIRFSVAESPFEQMIKDAEGFRQVELLNLKRSIDQQISQYKDLAKKRKITDEEAEKNKAAIMFEGLMKAYDIYDKETELEFKRNEKKIQWAKDFVVAYTKYANEQIAIGREVIKKAEAQYEKGSDDRVRITEDALKKIEALENSIIGVQKGAQEHITALTKESAKERLDYEYEYMMAQRERATEEAISHAEREGAQQKKKKEEVNVEIANLERQLAQERLRLLIELTNKIIAIYGLESEEFKQTREEMLNAQQELNKALADEAKAGAALGKKGLKLDFPEAKAAYEEGRLTAEEYFEYVKAAREEDLISETEFLDQKAILMESYWSSFKRGLLAARREVKSFSEMFYDIASELPRMFADNFVDAFSEVADGSKSFGEAMIDMFKTILKWIADTIMQLLIMKAIMSAMKGFGLFTGGGGGFHTEVAMPDVHKGGVPGVDPLPANHIVNPAIFESAKRLHDGLKSNEFPAILKKGEGVFTKGQMKALGDNLAGSTGTVINVPVNVSPEDPMLASKLRTNIEETVIKTLRQEMR